MPKDLINQKSTEKIRTWKGSQTLTLSLLTSRKGSASLLLSHHAKKKLKKSFDVLRKATRVSGSQQIKENKTTE